MSKHTRLHRFEFCYLRSFGTTDLKHSPQFGIASKRSKKCQPLLKNRPKEWATALALKHVLVSWDLWTYCIGFKLQHRHRHHHHRIFVLHIQLGGARIRRYDVVLVSKRLSHVRTYDETIRYCFTVHASY